MKPLSKLGTILCALKLVVVTFLAAQELPLNGSKQNPMDQNQLQNLVEQLNQKASELSNDLNTPIKSSGQNATKLSHEKELDQIRANIQLLKEIRSKKMKNGNTTEIELSENHMPGGSVTKTISHESKVKPFVFPDPVVEITKEPSEFQSQLPTIAAKRMVPRVVDAFELGNSLFLLDNLEQALVAYKEVKRRDLSEFDQIWLEFMVASCQRGLGNTKEAESSYRELVNDKKEIRFSEASSSWLNYLRRKQEIDMNAQKQLSKADELINQAQEYENDAKDRIGN